MEEIKCCYGCGRNANFQFKNGKWCCSSHMNFCPEVIRNRKLDSLKLWGRVKADGLIHLKDLDTLEDKNRPKPDMCEYGCGREAKFQLKNGKWICSPSRNSCPIFADKARESLRKGITNSGINHKEIYKNLPKETKERMLWSKGKTSYNDERLKNLSEKIKKMYMSGEIVSPFLGKKHSEETKKRISQSHKYDKSCKGGRGRKGWYKGYWCDSSWELAWVIYNLDHGIKFERNHQGFEYEYKGKKHKYYPDFILEDGTYVEIKGWLDEQTKVKIASFPFFLKIIDKNSIKPFLKFAKEKFGFNFVSQYGGVSQLA